MYELIDTREYGLETERPLLVVDYWRGCRRLVFSFQENDSALARQTLEVLNGPQE